MTDVQGRDKEAEAMYHVEVTRTVAVVAVSDEQAVKRAVERVGHLMVEEVEAFPTYCKYEVTGAENLAPADADAAQTETCPDDCEKCTDADEASEG